MERLTVQVYSIVYSIVYSCTVETERGGKPTVVRGPWPRTQSSQLGLCYRKPEKGSIPSVIVNHT